MVHTVLMMLNAFFLGFAGYNIYRLWKMNEEHKNTRIWFEQIDFLIHDASRNYQRPGILRMRMISIREQMGHKQAERTGISELIMQLERM